MSEKAELHENWWNHSDFTSCKVTIIFVEIYALINPWHLQFWELKCNLLQNGTKDLKFLDSDSDKKALQSTFAIWLVLMWMNKNLCIKLAL